MALKITTRFSFTFPKIDTQNFSIELELFLDSDLPLELVIIWQ